MPSILFAAAIPGSFLVGYALTKVCLKGLLRATGLDSPKRAPEPEAATSAGLKAAQAAGE